MTSPRLATGFSPAARSTMSSSGTSKRMATAAAARMLDRFAVPGSGVRISVSPIGVRTIAAVPSTPRSRTASARTSAGRSTPNVRTRPANFEAWRITRSSSALATSRESWFAPSRISALASAMASTVPKNSRCAGPTLVQTRTSGSAIFTSALISPAWFIPSSSTPMSGFARNSSSDNGSPMWLFKFPLLRNTV